MSREQKLISVHLEAVEDLDYMVFDFDNEKRVCMNDENCQNDLKSVFITLLENLLNYDIELKFVAKKEYKKGLFIDVCKEYVNELNREISEVESNIPKGLKEILI